NSPPSSIHQRSHAYCFYPCIGFTVVNKDDLSCTILSSSSRSSGKLHSSSFIKDIMSRIKHGDIDRWKSNSTFQDRRCQQNSYLSFSKRGNLFFTFSVLGVDRLHFTSLLYDLILFEKKSE